MKFHYSATNNRNYGIAPHRDSKFTAIIPELRLTVILLHLPRCVNHLDTDVIYRPRPPTRPYATPWRTPFLFSRVCIAVQSHLEFASLTFNLGGIRGWSSWGETRRGLRINGGRRKGSRKSFWQVSFFLLNFDFRELFSDDALLWEESRVIC